MSEKQNRKDVEDIPELLKELNGRSLLSLVSAAQSLLEERRGTGYREILRRLSKLEKVSITVEDRTPPVMGVSVDGLSWETVTELIKEISMQAQHSGIPITAYVADLGMLENVDTKITIRSLSSELTEIETGKSFTPKDILLYLE